MGTFRIMFLLASLMALAIAAPQEGDVAVASDKSDDSKSGVVVADQTWETWLSQYSVPILVALGGAILIAGGLGFGGYFFYNKYYQGNINTNNSGRSEPLDPYTGVPYRDFSSQGQVPGYPNQYYSTGIGRSLDTSIPSGWNVNWNQVLYMISLAQEAYEKFDFRTMDCQKKALCELSSKQEEFGETGRKISNSFSLLDAVEGLPMPTIIQNYLKEYRAAINDGKNNFKSCSELYSTCGFSLKDIVAKYKKKAESGKF